MEFDNKLIKKYINKLSVKEWMLLGVGFFIGMLWKVALFLIAIVAVIYLIYYWTQKKKTK